MVGVSGVKKRRWTSEDSVVNGLESEDNWPVEKFK